MEKKKKKNSILKAHFGPRIKPQSIRTLTSTNR
jgi:hypothetical protein